MDAASVQRGGSLPADRLQHAVRRDQFGQRRPMDSGAEFPAAGMAFLLLCSAGSAVPSLLLLPYCQAFLQSVEYFG